MEKTQTINNALYDTLGERWYQADDDPIALLRAESKIKCQWVESQIKERSFQGRTLLDVGCGGGFISNHFAQKDYVVTGVDLSQESLNVAHHHDSSKKAHYLRADAYSLPFGDSTFDLVCAMDFLEHVEDPAKVVLEISRVLKPNGLFFFHTFDRNPLSYLLVIKALEWLVPNTPENMHLYRMFVRPKELDEYCKSANLETLAWTGIKPIFLSKAFFSSLFSRRVHPEFSFETCSSTLLSYMGVAQNACIPNRAN